MRPNAPDRSTRHSDLTFAHSRTRAKIATLTQLRAGTQAAQPPATMFTLAPGWVRHAPTSIRPSLCTSDALGRPQNATFCASAKNREFVTAASRLWHCAAARHAARACSAVRSARPNVGNAPSCTHTACTRERKSRFSAQVQSEVAEGGSGSCRESAGIRSHRAGRVGGRRARAKTRSVRHLEADLCSGHALTCSSRAAAGGKSREVSPSGREGSENHGTHPRKGSRAAAQFSARTTARQACARVRTSLRMMQTSKVLVRGSCRMRKICPAVQTSAVGVSHVGEHVRTTSAADWARVEASRRRWLARQARSRGCSRESATSLWPRAKKNTQRPSPHAHGSRRQAGTHGGIFVDPLTPDRATIGP